MAEQLGTFLKEKGEEILKRMGIAATTSVSSAEDQTVLELTAKNEEEVASLIGFHGQTLNALQVVFSSLAARKVGSPVPLVVEAGGYRKEREEELRSRALEAADKARFLQKEVSFPAMPAFERRLIHLALEEEKGVKTESRGEGRERHVVVVPGGVKKE